MKKVKILIILLVGIIFILSSCRKDFCPGHGQIKKETHTALAE